MIYEYFFFQNGKGMQNSNNAYMLVYTSVSALNAIRSKSKESTSVNEPSASSTTPSRKTGAAAMATKKSRQMAASAESSSSTAPLKLDPLPIYLKAFIEEDRRLLDRELHEHIIMKQNKHKEQVSLKSKMRSIYERLPPTESDMLNEKTGQVHVLPVYIIIVFRNTGLIKKHH